MKSRRMHVCSGFALLTVLGGALYAVPALAQGPPEDGPRPGQGPQGGPPGGGPGGQGDFGPGGPGRPGRPGQGMRPMNQPMTVLHIPVAVLDSELKLTSAQKDKIAQLQKQFMQQARPTPPGQDPQADGPPDPETMRARMDKIRTLDQSTTKQIENLLTSSQKQALPALVKTMDALRVARIPMEVVGDLHLTADQKQQFSTLTSQSGSQNQRPPQGGNEGRQGGQFGGPRNAGGQPGPLHEKAMAILTSEQRKTVTDFMEKHPRPEGGRGFGPPGGGRPGGPGGQGGPDMPPPGGPGGEGDQGGPPPPGEPESRK